MSKRRWKRDPFAHVEHTTTGKGEPAFQATAAQRSLVTLLKGATAPDYVIAHHLGISRPTLYKHFRAELDTGHDLVVTQVATSLVKKAIKGDNTCMIYYLRTHGPEVWLDRQRLEHSGPDGAPMTPPMLVVSFLEDAVPDAPEVNVVMLDHEPAPDAPA